MSAQEQHIANRSDDARDANERLARAAEALRFISRVPMFCECDDPHCQAPILITLEHYQEIRRNPRLFLTAPSHRLEGGEPIRLQADVWVQRT